MSLRRNFFQRLQRRRWDAHTRRNPYFEHHSVRHWRMWLPWTAGSIAAILFAGLLLYAPILRIRSVEVGPLISLSEEDVRTRVTNVLRGRHWLFVPNGHRWFWDKERIESALSNAYFLESVEIIRDQATLRVNLKEKLSRFLWQSQDVTYLADERGTILSVFERKTGEAATLPLFVDTGDKPAIVGTAALPSDVVPRLLDFTTQAQQAGLQVGNIGVSPNNLTLLTVFDTDGYDVYVDATQDLAAQLQSWLTVIRSETKDLSRYQYIDVRYGSRIYIKER